MLTRRAFVGGAVGLAAGAARAAPVPADVARQPGIIVATTENNILFLDEAGTVVRCVRNDPRPGVRPCSVSWDGRTAAVSGPFCGKAGDPCPLLLLPLTGQPRPRPFMAPVMSADVWSWDGTRVIGSHLIPVFLMTGDAYIRNFEIEVATGRWTELQMPQTERARDGAPVSRHTVIDWSADGRWFLTRHWGLHHQPRPLHLVPADGGASRTIDLDPVRTCIARLSPNGRHLLVVREETEPGQSLKGWRSREQVLELRDVTGGVVTPHGRWRCANDDSFDGISCRWRADGRRIVILAQRRQIADGSFGRTPRPTGELVTMDPDGRNRRVVRSWVGAAPVHLLGWA